jgi:L-Ala-D/L-Glu epimerase
MLITTERLTLDKITPLTISRGTSASTVNLLVRVEHDGIFGLGEMAPSGATGDTAETAEIDVARFALELNETAPWELARVEAVLRATKSVAIGLNGVGGGGAARAALEIACHDWLGKKLGLPLWQFFGLDLATIARTSVTVGINSPEKAVAQTLDWSSRTGASIFKLKLGSPLGIAADKAMFDAVKAAAGPNAILRVDANGGWSLSDAIVMLAYLADSGVEYVEQPLAQGDEANLAKLRPSPLPIFLDETIRTSTDLPRVAEFIDGVNVKLMKCGGLREAIRIVSVARAFGLKTMLGCMGESSLAITAGAQISPLFDHLDLDSHLNLKNDAFLGASWQDGKVLPSIDAVGLGVARR